MMKLTVLLLVLCFAPAANAGPRDWVRHHQMATKFIVAGIAAGVHARGLAVCRSHGVENCDGRYGAAWAIWGVSTALNFIDVPLSEKIGGWPGNALSYGGSAAQLGHGIQQWRGGTNKVDMSKVELVERPKP